MASIKEGGPPSAFKKNRAKKKDNYSWRQRKIVSPRSTSDEIGSGDLLIEKKEYIQKMRGKEKGDPIS